MLNQEEYDKKEAMYSEVLRDLCDLHFAEGLHTGKWEDEDAMDESAEEYLETMTMLADKYHLEYDKNLLNYIEDEEYEAECYTMDRMGFEVREIVEKHLLEILVHKNG